MPFDDIAPLAEEAKEAEVCTSISHSNRPYNSSTEYTEDHTLPRRLSLNRRGSTSFTDLTELVEADNENSKSAIDSSASDIFEMFNWTSKHARRSCSTEDEIQSYSQRRRRSIDMQMVGANVMQGAHEELFPVSEEGLRDTKHHVPVEVEQAPKGLHYEKKKTTRRRLVPVKREDIHSLFTW